MAPVTPGDQTVSFIRSLVRELTGSPGENQLTTDYIDQTINNFYNSDFPYAIKIDQLRNVYTFYTAPFVDRYPLDVNYNQAVRAPFYVDGIKGFFYKDRDEFFRVWPRWPTLFQESPVSTTSAPSSTFSFTTGSAPILSQNINMGGVSSTGVPIRLGDDGNGNIQLQEPNPVVLMLGADVNNPGLQNLNTGNPGQDIVTNVGTVNYQTATFAFTIPFLLQSGTTLSVHVSQYQTGRPFSLLFWNNEFTIRPIPKLVHKCEIETYLTPVQFIRTTDNPILNQWAQYIGYGSAIEILRRRQDTGGVQNLMEGFKRQEGLVLERQANEEINMRNRNIFSDSSPTQGWNQGSGFGGWY